MTRKSLKLCLIVHVIRAVVPISVKTENVVATLPVVQTIANRHNSYYMDIFGYIDRTSIKTMGIYAIALCAFLTILIGWLVYLVVSSTDWTAWVQWLASIMIILFWCVCMFCIVGGLFLSYLYQKRQIIKEELLSYKQSILRFMPSRKH